MRRAATEAMCNLAVHPEALINFRNKDKLKIWFALADDYEADLATARAAAGALALAASDKGKWYIEVAGLVMVTNVVFVHAFSDVSDMMADKELGGIEVWRSLVGCGVADLVHRSLVGICESECSLCICIWC